MLLAGVSFQVFNMMVCGCLIVSYAWRRWRAINKQLMFTPETTWNTGNNRLSTLRHTNANMHDNQRKARLFIFSLTVSYIAIMVRCIYR